MKTKLLCIFTALGLLSSCNDATPDSISASNQANLSGEGEFIGTLKDGRKIVRHTITTFGNTRHYVYVVSDGSSVSSNYQEDKSGVKTTVVIDGKNYIEKP